MSVVFLSFEKKRKKLSHFLVKQRIVTKIFQNYFKMVISTMIYVILLENISLDGKAT